MSPARQEGVRRPSRRNVSSFDGGCLFRIPLCLAFQILAAETRSEQLPRHLAGGRTIKSDCVCFVLRHESPSPPLFASYLGIV